MYVLKRAPGRLVRLSGVLNDMDVILKRHTDVPERPQKDESVYQTLSTSFIFSRVVPKTKDWKKKQRNNIYSSQPNIIETMTNALSEQVDVSNKNPVEAKPKAASKAKPKFPKKFVLDALEQSSDEDGWAQLGTFGSYLTKLQSDFDSRNFGFKKLFDLVRSKTDLFVLEERNTAGLNKKQLYIRAK